MLTVETESSLGVTCCWNDTILVVERTGEEEVTILVTAGYTEVGIPNSTSLEEITDILGTNDNLKKAFVENNSAFVLDGRNSIKEVYTTHFEKEL